mgnify:FL=1
MPEFYRKCDSIAPAPSARPRKVSVLALAAPDACPTARRSRRRTEYAGDRARAGLQAAIECLTHMSGQRHASSGQVLDKNRVMALDDRVEQHLLGALALVIHTTHFHSVRPHPLHQPKRQDRSQQERRRSGNGLSAGRNRAQPKSVDMEAQSGFKAAIRPCAESERRTRRARFRRDPHAVDKPGSRACREPCMRA